MFCSLTFMTAMGVIASPCLSYFKGFKVQIGGSAIQTGWQGWKQASQPVYQQLIAGEASLRALGSQTSEEPSTARQVLVWKVTSHLNYSFCQPLQI